MWVSCVAALLISGASGEISGCVVDPDGAHTCHAVGPFGDATNLLQLHNRQQDKGEFETASLLETATLTRRCGKVKSVLDTLKSPIHGAKLQIQGQGQNTTTDEKGQFCFEQVAKGNATLIATKDGWVKEEKELEITESMDGIQVLMAKEVPSRDWVIILKWGKTPLDLDSRTQFGKNEGACAVFYDKKGPTTCGANGITATLNQDHCYYKDGKHSCRKTSGPGGPSEESKPETTTLTNVVPENCFGDDCKIVFHVSNFVGTCSYWDYYYRSQGQHSNLCGKGPDKDTGTLESSQAEVTVIHGDKVQGHFKIADVESGKDGVRRYPGGPTEEWFVFSIDVKTSTVKACENGGVCF